HTLRVNPLRVVESLFQPAEIGCLPCDFLVALPQEFAVAPDRDARARLGLEIGVVVVRALDVEAQVDDRAEPPSLVFRISLGCLPRNPQRVLSEAPIRREEKHALEIEALFWIGVRQCARAVASPAVSPVVVARNEDERLLEAVEVVLRRVI